MVQYEQYEQEMKHLQQLIESAHREIEDKPVATSNIQELQAQITRHEVRDELQAECQRQETTAISNCERMGFPVPNVLVPGHLLWLSLHFKCDFC